MGVALQRLLGPSSGQRSILRGDVVVVLDFTRILDLGMIRIGAIDEGDLLRCVPTRRQLRSCCARQGGRAVSGGEGGRRILLRHGSQVSPFLG